MAYTRQYRITHLNFRGVTCEANLYDTYSEAPDTFAGIPKLITGGGNPITIASVDSAEDKFTPIKAKKCTIQFLSSNSYSLPMFVEGEDNRWLVEVVVNDVVIFTGFLIVDDCREPYQPHPSVVTLTATDNLGTLKEIPLTDFDGNVPYDKANGHKFPIIKFIAWALAKTGLKLNIRVINNLVEESSAENSIFYKDNYLWVKTFEGSEPNTCVNCYEVLNRILKYDSFLQQRNGAWWIMRVDEMETGVVYPHIFGWDGTFWESENPINIDYQVGRLRDSHFINADQEVMLVRKHKFDKLTYKFQYPKELIDNQSFIRGDIMSPAIVPDKDVTIDSGGDPIVQRWTGTPFHLDDWESWESGGTNPDFTPAIAPTPQIVRYYFEGYEKERYVRIQRTVNRDNVHIIKSSLVPMDAKDRFKFSVDWRADKNQTGAPGYPIGLWLGDIRLFGYDGSFWRLSNEFGKTEKGTWIRSLDGTFYDTPGGYFGYHWDVTQQDETEWMTASVEATGLPVAGDVQFCLLNEGTYVTEDIHFTNINFDYEPYINGGYRMYDAQYNKTEIEGNWKANIDDEVYISDSPKKLFKGALFKKNAEGKFVLCGNYYNAAVFRTRPEWEFFHPYGYTQVYAVHNQYNKTFTIISGSVQNMNAVEGDKMPDSMRVYTIAEEGSHAEGKKFMLANFTKNLRLEEWQATFIEVYNNAGKDYSAKHESKYI